MMTCTFDLPRVRADEALTLTEVMPAVSVDVGEHASDDSMYKLTWWLPAELRADFEAYVLAHGMCAVAPAMQPVDESVDYVALTRSQFPPLTIGRIFVARNDEPCPEGLLKLDIMPNRAFGSGEHATTTACLEMLQEVLGERSFSHALDVGAGSGILALALTKLTGAPSVGTDNDPASVQICTHNAVTNGLGALMHCVEDEDLMHADVVTRAPYPLIFANILLQPLCELAPRLAALLADDGVLISSGTTAVQLAELTAAFNPHGLRMVRAKTIPQGEWAWQAICWAKE